jgi:hypothetical protein
VICFSDVSTPLQLAVSKNHLRAALKFNDFSHSKVQSKCDLSQVANLSAERLSNARPNLSEWLFSL